MDPDKGPEAFVACMVVASAAAAQKNVKFSGVDDWGLVLSGRGGGCIWIFYFKERSITVGCRIVTIVVVGESTFGGFLTCLHFESGVGGYAKRQREHVRVL